MHCRAQNEPILEVLQLIARNLMLYRPYTLPSVYARPMDWYPFNDCRPLLTVAQNETPEDG